MIYDICDLTIHCTSNTDNLYIFEYFGIITMHIQQLRLIIMRIQIYIHFFFEIAGIRTSIIISIQTLYIVIYE